MLNSYLLSSKGRSIWGFDFSKIKYFKTGTFYLLWTFRQVWVAMSFHLVSQSVLVFYELKSSVVFWKERVVFFFSFSISFFFS